MTENEIAVVAKVWDLDIGVLNDHVYVRTCGELGCTEWRDVEANDAYTALIVRIAELCRPKAAIHKYVESQVAALKHTTLPAWPGTDEDMISKNPTCIVDTNTTYNAFAWSALNVTRFDAPFCYVMVVHPSQIGHLKENSRWLNRVSEALVAARVFVKDAIGLSDKVLIVESEFVGTGADANGAALDTCRRAVVFGAEGLSKAHTLTTFSARWPPRE